MSDLSIGIIGDGKMGRAIERLARERGIRVEAVVGGDENRGGRGIDRARFGTADVLVEFTEPGSAAANVRAALRAGYPVVVGTTGWYGDLDELSQEALESGGAMLWSANFSVGVNLFFLLAERSARLLARISGFDAHIVETHHAAKRDAPSGTALTVQQRVAAASGRAVPVTSVRTGHVPGTHELIFDAPFEQIRLVHEARDRRVFAEGALLAAAWLRGRSGVFTMSDVLVHDAGGE